MFQNLKNLLTVSGLTCKTCTFQSSFSNVKLLRTVRYDFFGGNSERDFHTNHLLMKKGSEQEEIRRAAQQTHQYKEIEGERAFEADYSIKSGAELFPTVDLPNRLFNGIAFKHLPIVHIKSTKNNTILTLSDKGVTLAIRSGGTEGFKNTRKGTNIAAQTAGVSLGMRALKKGVKTVRVLLKGLGPGRVSAVKGVQMSGVDVVSVTDRTPDFYGLRPKKQRRI